MNNLTHCPGCGAAFQRKRDDQPGFLPEGKEPAAETLCKRCFQLKHYSTLRKAHLSDADVLSSIQEAAKTASAVFLVVDATSVEEGMADVQWLEGLDVPVFVMVTKADLLDRWVSRLDLQRWVAEQTGLPEKQISVLSSLHPSEVRELRQNIESAFERDDRIFLLGAPNVGKSTLLASLLRRDGPTMSPMPGTTIGLMEYPMERGPVLQDAPGLGGSNPWLKWLCPDCLTALTPRRRLIHEEVMLKTGQAVCFGGLVHVTVTEAGDRGWIRAEAFGSDGLTIHKTSAVKIPALLEQHLGEMLTPPCKACAKALVHQRRSTQTFLLHTGQDLVIPGVGWLALYSGFAEVTVEMPDFLECFLRPWLVPSQSLRSGSRRGTLRLSVKKGGHRA